MTIDPELDALRRAIDDIDRRILELVSERIKVVLRVGEYKRERGLAIYDPDRERNVIERLIRQAPAPLNASTVRRIFERLIDESRHIEQHVSEFPPPDEKR